MGLLAYLRELLAGDLPHEGLEPPVEDTARQEHPSPTGGAADADIRPDTHDLPLVAAARVRFAQADHIADAHVYDLGADGCFPPQRWTTINIALPATQVMVAVS
jgi:hypothetical protein